MTRAKHSRKSIFTRKGWREIRIERRAIPGVCVPVQELIQPHDGLGPILARNPSCLADEIARAVRNGRFPREYWELS